MITARDAQALPTKSKNMDGIADWFRSIFTVQNANYMRSNPGKSAPIRSQAMPYSSSRPRQQSEANRRLLQQESQRELNRRAVPYLGYFSTYSRQYGIPYGLLQALAERESSMNPTAGNRNGYYGLMQIGVPHSNGTYARTWTRNGTPPPRSKFDRGNPRDSIQFTAWYLRTILYPRFRNWPQAVAAYNVGETALQRIVNAHGANWRDALNTETRDYINYAYAKTGIG